MKSRISILILGIIFMACGPGSIITVENPVVYSGTLGGVTGFFGIVTNHQGFQDRLIGATSNDAGMVQVHQTKVENNVMTMAEVPGLDVPSQGKLELKRGGYHIMLMDLKKDLNPGDPVTVTLKFEKSPQVTVTTQVVKR